MQGIYLVGTADTKGEELAFLHRLLSSGGLPVVSVDVGTRSSAAGFTISADDIAACHPAGAGKVLNCDDRGTAVQAMADAFKQFCATHSPDIQAMIGIGGGGGTSIIAAGMRQLNYGVPKVMVSTLASGDVAPYVDISDIVMFPSVTDIAGLNRLSRVILHNAAQAVLGMAGNPPVPDSDDKPAIGLSMFGVTTPSVTAISAMLSDRFDCLVFHATGTGGRAMEKLADDGILRGLIDITTTEICDLLFGGVLPAADSRLDVVARKKLPYVGSVGALDMVNFWAPETVPARFKSRNLYFHNSNVTLMRTNPDECAEIGNWIGQKLNQCDGPVRFLIPEAGVSALDVEDGPFWNPEADLALFETLKSTVTETDNRQILSLPFHINDPEFSAAAAKAYLNLHQN